MDTPDDWTPEHSVAALLVGMSMIDGEVDSTEMRALIDTLRGFPGVASGDVASIGKTAYTWVFDAQESGRDLIDIVRELAAELGLEYDEPTLREIHERLRAMADADGEVHPLEARLLKAFAMAWEL